MIYCHFECETYCYQYLLVFGKKLFKKEEDVVNIQVDLLVSSGDDFFDDEVNNEFDKKINFIINLKMGLKTGKKYI